MLLELLQSLNYHHWFLFALGLLVLEVFFGGVFLLWLGMTSLLLAAIVLFFPGLNWQLQLVIFGIGAVTSFILRFRYVRAHRLLEARGSPDILPELYTGSTLVLSQPVVEGEGMLTIDGVDWVIDAGDENIPAGEKVTVIEQKISTLVVRKQAVENDNDPEESTA